MAVIPVDEQAIFEGARKIDAGKARDAYVRQSCGGDAALEQRIRALLHAYDEGASFLEVPAASPGLTIDQPISEFAGAVIGPYKLIEEIGEGGMGTVWMAQQTEPVKRLVALKLIKSGMDSKQVIARFEAERQALALMDHQHIAKILDGGTTSSGRPYFVMDLVKGVPITKYCDEHRLTPRQRLELFIPVCQAVQHAHQKGIIHRDLKPSNVLVALYDGKPVPKVIDFGVAKAAGQPLTDRTLVTGFGNIVGTLEYMSPEQAEINQLDIDTRSDIYSLGVLLYELLTGTTPLERKRHKETPLLEMLRLVREQDTPTLSNRLSSTAELPAIAANRGTDPARLTRLVRGELDWIVMKALEKDRTRRYETANGFAMDVQRYLADEPVLACPPSVVYQLRKWLRRNSTLAWALGSILVLAVVAGGFAYRAQRQYERNLLEVSQRSVLERATVTALGGQFQKAEKVVEEARELQADPGEIALLSGLIAMYSGQHQAALDHLKKAVRLKPRSAAAWGGLAVAYGYVGPWDDWVKAMFELEPLTPETPLDHFFKAWADGTVNPRRGLDTLKAEKAGFGDSPPVLPRLVRADVAWQCAESTGEVKYAEQAIKDADAVEPYLPLAPVYSRMHARLVAYHIYKRDGNFEASEKALADVGKDANALEPHRAIPDAALLRWEYLRHVVGGDKVAREELRHAFEKSEHHWIGFEYAMLLYRLGDLESAYNFVEANRQNVNIAPARVFIVAEWTARQTRDANQGVQAGLRAFEDWKALGPKGLGRVLGLFLLAYLNKLEENTAFLDEIERHLHEIPPSPDFAVQEMVEYLRGNLPEDKFLADAILQPHQPCSLHRACSRYLCIGLKRLSAGSRAGARECFQKAFDSGCINVPPYLFSSAFLSRIKDPAWPPWIPMK